MIAAAAHVGGCVFKTPIDCENALVDCGTGGASASSTGAGGGGAGGTPSSCIPSESSVPVASSCGAFVSSSLGKDTNAGTREAPFATLGAALAKLDGGRVYACAEALSFTEALTISATAELYGGLDCKSWAYVGTKSKTRLTATADAVPLTLTADAKIADFAILAADATIDGGSSITVIADHATARFSRCDLGAGAGKAGLTGTMAPDPLEPTLADDPQIRGNDGANACSDPTSSPGGVQKENDLCPSANGVPVGGQGGNGHPATGSNGDSSPPTAETALGGVGQPGINSPNLWSCQTSAGNGGKNGADGVSGEGARSVASIGTLDKSGYNGVAGWPGLAAKPGQGGGGGGGARGKSMCAGASGGGGGAGGCGGLGGNGGRAGGASIALLSLGATLSFDKVKITTGSGGQGGDGGSGRGGGVGGNGGNGGIGDSGAPPTTAACNGGKGGQGGTGGKGGGGRGGHTIGIASSGAVVPSTKGITFSTKGTPGKGGAGEIDGMHDGDPGVQAEVQVFP